MDNSLAILPYDTLVEVMSYLTCVEVNRMGAVSRSVRAASESEGVWLLIAEHLFGAALLQRDAYITQAPDVPRTTMLSKIQTLRRYLSSKTSTTPDSEVSLTPTPPLRTALLTSMHNLPCRRCHGGYRSNHLCECIIRRQIHVHLPKPKLILASLSMNRVSDSGSVDWPPMKQALVTMLQDYNLSLVTVDDISEEFFQKVRCDMFICNLTSAVVPLSEAEQSALQGYVTSGGTALLNCFSMWANNGVVNRDLVGWLGINNPPGCRGDHAALRQMRPSAHPDVAALLNGPFGPVKQVKNLYETRFTGGPADAIWLAETLLFIPPGTAPVNAGAVFVCSNMHWMVNKSGWNGGFSADEGNTRLMQNLAAFAATLRMKRVSETQNANGVVFS